MLKTLKLYVVRIYGPGGLVGSIVAATVDHDGATKIGSQWATERNIEFKYVVAKRHRDERPVFTNLVP